VREQMKLWDASRPLLNHLGEMLTMLAYSVQRLSNPTRQRQSYLCSHRPTGA
jgi:hypothetical protein